MVYRNRQAVFGRVALAVPKKRSYRLVADYRAVKNMTETAAMPIPNLEELGRKMAGASVSCTLDLLQGSRQCPLDEAAQEVFAMATGEGLFKPKRVPQRVLNATSYFSKHDRRRAGRVNWLHV